MELQTLAVVGVEIEPVQVLLVLSEVLVVEPLLRLMELQLPLLVVVRQHLFKVIVGAIQARLAQMFAMVGAAVQARLGVMYLAHQRLLEVAARVYPVQLQALLLPVVVAVEAETVKQLLARAAQAVAVLVAQIVL